LGEGLSLCRLLKVLKNNELGSGLDNQFILATSTAVVIVVCFIIWNFLELL
jgi:hypothetical protein